MSQRTELANALRALAMDAVQRANSGHPGMPMGMADIAEALWRHHLKHDPTDPRWPDRDRFVLSNGHGSMLLYGLLHLTGYDLPIDELARFRQLHSRTPGHPEIGVAPGVETTTGPLGQGIANAVGMALAERLLAQTYNRPGHTVIDHRTWVFLGDGCLMEGVSHEACALAGTLKLGKLVAFWDDNRISIDSEQASIDHWFTDDTPARFEAYGWHVIRGVDGHDAAALDAAIVAAKAVTERPVLVCCRTVIGKGAPKKQNTGGAHGAPLGDAEIAAAREALGWTYPPFEIPDAIRAAWDARAVGAAAHADWNTRFAAYAQAYPAEAAVLQRRLAGALPDDLDATLRALVASTAQKAATVATRKASQNAIEAIAPALPELLGGSADLAGSNNTLWSGSKPVVPSTPGNYVFYGVREFAMAAVMNGAVLHGGFIPYGGTFLVFSDYARNAIRLAALMRLGVVYVLTHDSIGLGEDGPTHQPVEHAASLRLLPGLDVWRPCDAVETAAAWRAAILRRDGPTALLLSRQNLPHQPRDAATLDAIASGGYVLAEAGDGRAPRVVLIATGSEVALATDARAQLEAAGTPTRVVSMPCTELFDRQPAEWRRAVLPPGVARVAIEAGVTDGWRKYVGLDGEVVGLDRFGESAPAADLFRHFGFTPERVVEAAGRAIDAQRAAATTSAASASTVPR
jgi:transketolase